MSTLIDDDVGVPGPEDIFPLVLMLYRGMFMFIDFFRRWRGDAGEDLDKDSFFPIGVSLASLWCLLDDTALDEPESESSFCFPFFFRLFSL